jgi:hypothetical protein
LFPSEHALRLFVIYQIVATSFPPFGIYGIILTQIPISLLPNHQFAGEALFCRENHLTLREKTYLRNDVTEPPEKQGFFCRNKIHNNNSTATRFLL